MKENDIERFSLAEIQCRDFARLVDFMPKSPIISSSEVAWSVTDRQNVLLVHANILINQSRLSEAGKLYLINAFSSVYQTGMDSTADGEYEDALAQIIVAPFGKDAGIFGSEAQLHEKHLLQNAIDHHIKKTRKAIDLPSDNDQFLDAVDTDNYEVLFDQNPIGQSNYEWLQAYLSHWQDA